MLPRCRLLPLLIVAACSAGGERTPSTSDDSTTGTETGSDEVFRIGLIVPQTGPAASFGPPVRDAVTLAVDTINAAGGVNGTPIEVKVRDSKTTPEGGIEAAILLSQDPEIRAFIGALSSSVSKEVAGVASAAGVPMISPASTSAELTDFPAGDVFFRTVPSDALQGRVLAKYAIDAGYQVAAVLYVQNTYGDSLKGAFEAAFDELGGVVPVTQPHAEEEAAPDYERDLQAVADMDPPADVIVLITFQKQGVQIMQDQELFALPGAWLLADGLRTEDLSAEAGPALLAGVRGTAPAAPSGPQYDAFATAYQDRWGLSPGAFTAQAWDAVHLLALAAQRAGSFERAALLESFGWISGPPGVEITPAMIPAEVPTDGDVDFRGASGPVDWDDHGDPATALYEVYEFQADGTIQQVELIEPGP